MKPIIIPRDKSASYVRMRKYILAREPLCRVCKNEIATQIDHIIRLRDGGTNKIENLQPICKDCHDEKSRIERGGKPKVVVDNNGRPIGKSNLDRMMGL